MPRTIAEENSMLGAYNWKISRGDESGTKLQGYVKPQYTKPGLTISFHASTELDDCQFFLRIYRLGWYRGAGARQVHRSKIISVGNNGIWSKDNGWQHNEKCGDAIVGMDWPRVSIIHPRRLALGKLHCEIRNFRWTFLHSSLLGVNNW